MTPDQIEITNENLIDVQQDIPGDQARELEVGCSTWGIFYEGGQRGQMTTWPNGRGAIFLGGDSLWGEWNENTNILTLDEPDPDGGWPIRYNSNGTQVDIFHADESDREDAEEMYRDSDGVVIPDGWHYCSAHDRLELNKEACPLATSNGEC